MLLGDVHNLEERLHDCCFVCICCLLFLGLLLCVDEGRESAECLAHLILAGSVAPTTSHTITHRSRSSSPEIISCAGSIASERQTTMASGFTMEEYRLSQVVEGAWGADRDLDPPLVPLIKRSPTTPRLPTLRLGTWMTRKRTSAFRISEACMCKQCVLVSPF